MADRKQDPLPVNFPLGNNIMASVAVQQNTPADEEIAAEADEPSDNCRGNLPNCKLQQDLYKKKVVNTHGPHRCDSLLTRAIISDSEPYSAENSIYSRVSLRIPKRGMSTNSAKSSVSMPSTAGLTSDGDDSSNSDLSSPSPQVVPVFGLGITGAENKKDNVAIQGHSEDELSKAIQPDPCAIVEALGRKRCISFACTGLLSRNNSDKSATIKIVEPTPTRRPTLKFACNVKDESKPPRKLSSPPPTAPSTKCHRSPVLESAHLQISSHQRRDSAATVVDERNGSTPRKTSPVRAVSYSSNINIPRFYEFASSVDESVHSWMNAPQFPSRLLKVDGLLEKEKRIRKLSEEVDAEVAFEEDDDNLDEDDEDDGYKEDEEDDEHDYEMWSDSDEGNKSDDEHGFAESDSEEDFFLPATNAAIIPDRQIDRPTCCRNTSDSSVASVRHTRKRGLSAFQREKRTSIRPSTPELPDSTDFVPGTFDEDKVLEDFYLSCMEERKTLNKVVKPQDIDPSFPTEEEDEEEAESPVRVGRRRGSTVRHSSHSRSPRGSPAPARRLRSPPPLSRRGSRNMSPPPNKRRPSFTSKSPPPQGRIGRLRQQFDLNRPSLARSTSLPRHGPFLRKKSYLGYTSTSPKPSKAIPFRQRGVLDIVNGLEGKRIRHRENIYGRPKEYRAEAGEGVEKMREVGIMGRERLGANAAAKWMMSV